MNNSQIDALDFFKNRGFITKISNTETIQSVKKNVFIKYQGFIIPEIMALGDSKKYITTMKKSIQVVYVYNLIDELTKYIFDNISIFLDINNTSTLIETLFNSLKNAYTDLTQDYLVIVIKYILYKNAGFQDFKRDVENFEKNVIDAKIKIMNKKNENNENFKKNAGKGIFNVDKKGNYIYSLINCIISIKFEGSINLSRILKGVSVSNRVPVMGADKVGIKIFKGFPKNISEDWLFTRNKAGKLKPKLLKGLTLKVKSDNFLSDDYYYTVIISENSKSLVARLNWKKNEYVTFEDVKSYVKDGLSEVIDKINKVDTLNIKKFDYSKISYSVIQVNTSRNFNLIKISQAATNFGDMFKKQENSGRFLRLTYDETGENITIVIKNSEYIIDGIEFKNNVVEFLNVTPFTDLQKIIDQVGSLFIKSETKRLLEFKNSKLVEIKQVKDVGKKVKETLGTKVLKEAGAEINSVSCQKRRQPTLYIEGEPTDTYTLDYNGKKYACKNKEKGYVYPGFTSQKSPCCFTKDQRSKEIYKNMTMTTDVSDALVITSDSYIISKTRVIHNLKGVILSNRIGILPDTISDVFGGGDNLFKLGVAHDNFTLLNIFNRATAKNINHEKINSFTKKYNETTYTKMNSIKILEYLEFYFKINAVIIDNETDSFLCNKITGLLFSDTIFIIKRPNYSYELLVEKINSEKIKKTFQKGDTVFKNFLINYNKSCVIHYANEKSIVPYSVPEFLSKGYTINGQIINAFDKIIYLVSHELGIVPVIPYRRLPGIPVKDISDARLSFTTQYDKLKNAGINYLKIKGLSKNTKNLIDGIVTASNIIIPVSPSKSSNFKNFPVIFYGYYGEDVDMNLAHNQEPTTNDYYSIKNMESFYYRELYYRLKYTCSRLFNEKKDLSQLFDQAESKTEFLALLLKPVVIFYKESKTLIKVKTNNRNVCSDIPIEICSQDTFCGTDNLKTKCLLKIPESLFRSFIKKLCIEMKWNKDILSGNVKKEDTGKNNFPVRKNEIVLVTPQDFENFFNKL